MKTVIKKMLVTTCCVLATAASVFAMTYDEVSTQGKPVVVMFHQHGCGACRKLSPLFDKISKRFSDKFSFAKEDVANSKLATKFNFDTVPQVYIINPKTGASTQMDQNCIFDQGCFENSLKKY